MINWELRTTPVEPQASRPQVSASPTNTRCYVDFCELNAFWTPSKSAVVAKYFPLGLKNACRQHYSIHEVINHNLNRTQRKGMQRKHPTLEPNVHPIHTKDTRYLFSGFAHEYLQVVSRPNILIVLAAVDIGTYRARSSLGHLLLSLLPFFL